MKASERLRPDHFRGFKAIQGLKGLKQSFLLYLGSREYRTAEGVLVLPVEKFFSEIGKWF